MTSPKRLNTQVVTPLYHNYSILQHILLLLTYIMSQGGYAIVDVDDEVCHSGLLPAPEPC
jgi:hypothetical protein